MMLSDRVVDELACVWVRMHRSAAETHLTNMIGQMRRAGDKAGGDDYARILAAVSALRFRSISSCS